MFARLCVLVWIFSMPVWAEPPKLNLRFDELPKMVREKNGNATGARQAYQAAQERTGYLKRSFLPTLNLRTGTESAKVGSSPRESQGYWSAEAKLNVFRGGKDSLEEQILQSKAKSSKAQAIKDYQTALKLARQTYWNLAATQILIGDYREAIEKNEENIRNAKKRAGAGVATGADGVHFELEKTTLTQNLKRLEHEEDVLKSKLAVLVGIEDHEKVKIDVIFPHPPEAEFQEQKIAPEKNVEVTILRENESVERLRGRQSGRWYAPKLDLYARYGLPSLGDDYTMALRNETEFIAGVSLSLDLGETFQDRAVQSAQSYEARGLSERADQRSKTIQAESHELQHDLRLLHELIHDADRDVQRAQEFLRLTKTEYARGAKNGPDLLEAFLKFYEFRKRKTELNLEYQLAKAEFESLSATESDLL